MTRTPRSTAFRKGDAIVTVLSGFGEETREDGVILYVRAGVAYVDNGHGNDPTAYDATTGRYALGDGFGFSRRIERAVEPKASGATKGESEGGSGL